MTIALDSTNNSELVARLEEAALNGLPALQTEFYDGWIVRMAEGYSRRANCVVPLYESTTPLQEKLVHCEAAYAIGIECNPPLIWRTETVEVNASLGANYARTLFGNYLP